VAVGLLVCGGGGGGAATECPGTSPVRLFIAGDAAFLPSPVHNNVINIVRTHGGPMATIQGCGV